MRNPASSAGGVDGCRARVSRARAYCGGERRKRQSARASGGGAGRLRAGRRDTQRWNTPRPSADAPGPDDGASSTDSAEPAYPRSTLEAIGGRVLSAARSDDGPSSQDDRERTSEHNPKNRPLRVAVEGPDDFGQDIRLIALRLAAACTGDGIDKALAEATGSATPALRAAAFEAIARRAAAMSLAPGLTEIVIDALSDDDPPVRATAARALAARGDAVRHLFPAARRSRRRRACNRAEGGRRG